MKMENKSQKRNRPWASEYIFVKEWKSKMVEAKFSLRSANGSMGRFGGGWN